MTHEIHPENARARRDMEAGQRHHNMSPKMTLLFAQIQKSQQDLRDQLEREYPIGTRITVEDIFHGARFIRGPVLKHGSPYQGAEMTVLNEKTGKARRIDPRSFIYKED